MLEDKKANISIEVPLSHQVSGIQASYREIIDLMSEDPRTLAALPHLNDLCQFGAISPIEVSSNFRRRDTTSLDQMAEYSERAVKVLADYERASKGGQKEIVKTTRAALSLLAEINLSPRSINYIASELIKNSGNENFIWKEQYEKVASTVATLIEKQGPVIEMMVKTTLKEIPIAQRDGFKEDLTQEGILSAYRALHGFNPENNSDFRSYLKISVQNSCRDFYRYNKLSISIPRNVEISSMSQVSADPSTIDKDRYTTQSAAKYELLAELERVEEMAALKSAVSQLKPHDQFIIERHYGLANKPNQSKESLGEVLGIKSTSVGAKIRVIHERLHGLLAPRLAPDESTD